MTINRDQLEPVTKLDPRYSQPDAVATPWPVTEAALEAAELAWLVTVRPERALAFTQGTFSHTSYRFS